MLFETFSQRYERGSAVLTSNLPFEDWTSVLGSERLTGALLDRLTHHVSILSLNGDSYRLKSSRSRRSRADGRRSKTRPRLILTILRQARSCRLEPHARGRTMKGPDRAPSSFKLLATTGLVLLRRSGLELVRPLQKPALPTAYGTACNKPL